MRSSFPVTYTILSYHTFPVLSMSKGHKFIHLILCKKTIPQDTIARTHAIHKNATPRIGRRKHDNQLKEV